MSTPPPTKKQNPAEDPRLIGSIVALVLGLALGPFLTAFLPHSVETWWLWPGVRVGLALGGAGWFGLELGRLVGRVVPSVLVALLLASLVSYAPILDLVRGPLVVTGSLGSLEKSQIGMGGSRSNRWYDIELKDVDGTVHHLQPKTLSSDRWAKRLAECDEQRRFLRVTALRHLDEILDVECPEGTLQ